MVAQSIIKIKPSAGFFILMVRRLDATNKIKELVEGLITIGLLTRQLVLVQRGSTHYQLGLLTHTTY